MKLKARKNPLLESGININVETTTARMSRKNSKTEMESILAGEKVGKLLENDLQKNQEVFILNRGGFSVVDVILAVGRKVGPSRLDVCSWTIGETDFTRIHGLCKSGLITQCRWIIDGSLARRKTARYHQLIEIFGKKNIRIIKHHAKIFLVYNDDWKFTILSSANLNQNLQTEFYLIRECSDFLNFNKDFFDKLFSAGEA